MFQGVQVRDSERKNDTCRAEVVRMEQELLKMLEYEVQRTSAVQAPPAQMRASFRGDGALAPAR